MEHPMEPVVRAADPTRFLRVVTGILLCCVLMGTPRLCQLVIDLRHADANRHLVNAILHNDTAGVKAALREGANPNAERVGFAWTDFAHPLTNLMMGDINIHLRDTPLLLTMDSTVKRDPSAVRPTNADIPLENLEIVKALVEAGADVNARSPIGSTPLMMACEWEYNSTAIYLLEHHAAPNIPMIGGDTPIQMAATYGDIPLIKTLLAHGADPNLKDILGGNALHMAVLPPETPSQVETVRVLLAAHADPTIKNNNGLTPEQFAQQEGRTECAKLLAVHRTKQ